MDWTKFQLEVGGWSKRNFGEQPSHRQLLGILEELGELAEAIDINNGCVTSAVAEISDAVGDTLIYMADYCYKTDRSLEVVAHAALGVFSGEKGEIADELLFFVPLHSIVRSIAHHQLKLEQGIRKNENHEAELTKTLVRVVGHLLKVCFEHGLDLDYCVEKSWQQVGKRDWIKDPNKGGET